MGKLTEAGSDGSGLASLSITGFRGIGQLQIPRLGRVALLAGKNGVGKTTVLEALRLYADRGSPDTLQEVLDGREELSTFRDEKGGAEDAPAVDRLFHPSGGDRNAIAIGPVNGEPKLEIMEVDEQQNLPERVREIFAAEDVRILRVAFDDAHAYVPWKHSAPKPFGSFRMSSTEAPPKVRCESIGSVPPRSAEVARLWDSVVLTASEALPLTALRLVFGDLVERTAVIGDGTYQSRRRVVVKLANEADPVPLKSLGEGAVRMFGIALALANCRDGLLLIDEAENGIHYTLQRKFWNMVLHSARTHNTQVVATTHSKDCIDGFAAAALQCLDVSANLVRIDRHNDELHAVEYSKQELETAAEQHLEVR